MMHCFECAAAMPDNMIYCLNCGAKLDGEAKTVVRPKVVIMPPVPSRTEIAGTWIRENARRFGAVLAFMIGAAVVAGVIYFGFAKRPETTFGYDSPPKTATPTPAANPTPEVVIVTSTPQPTRPPKPKATPTPISIDEVQGKITDDEMRARNVNANRPPVLPPPVITEFNRQGEQLRAICKNGEPSYWQFDKWATCGMNGGVARWNPRHPKN